jgi:spoIIIJ-associated protein
MDGGAVRLRAATRQEKSSEAMQDLKTAAQQTADFLKMLTTTGGLRLRFRITAGAGAADPDGLEDRLIYVEMSGPDAGMLTARDGELLRSLEHVCAKILRLEPDEHDRLSFDADGYKAARNREILDAAQEGIDAVRQSGRPYKFDPMSSRERRMLHLALKKAEGMRTESSGEGPSRFVVLYPENWKARETDDRARNIRERFRRR